MTYIRRTSRPLPEQLPSFGVLVLESHHADDFYMDWRRHPFLKLIYALRGAGQLLLDGGSHDFSAGDLMFVPRGMRNRIVDRADSPSSLYVCCLARSLFDFDPAVENQLPPGRLPAIPGLAEDVERTLRRLTYWQNHRTGGPLTAVAESLGLVNRIVRQQAEPTDPDTRDPAMAAYVRHLDENFFDVGDLDVEAARLGMSRRAFTARFRAATGQTWLEYVRGRAIDHACRLLAETDAAITSVAFECGFADLSTFYRQFKSRTGRSPAAWRAEQRELSG